MHLEHLYSTWNHLGHSQCENKCDWTDQPENHNEHWFILVAIGYFIKYIEACSYVHVTQKIVKHFIKKELICQYGSLKKMVIDNT